MPEKPAIRQIPPPELAAEAATLRPMVDQLFAVLSPHMRGDAPDPYATMLWTAVTIASAAVAAVEAEDPRTEQPIWLVEVAVSLLHCTRALHTLGDGFIPPAASAADGIPIGGRGDQETVCTLCGLVTSADQARYAYGPPAASLPRPVCGIECARAVHAGEAGR